MALALNLMNEPTQPYLTTGATDYADSVTKGKNTALAQQSAELQNHRSAFDLRELKKKSDREAVLSGSLPELIKAADNAELTAQQKSDLVMAMPEFADKLIKTNDAKAKENVSNFLGSSLLKLTHSTDKNSDTAAILDAARHYGINLNLSEQPTPEELQNALNVAFRGAESLKGTTAELDAEGNVISKNVFGETTDIKPSTNRPKAVPVIENGKEKTRPISLPNGRTRTERLMTDGTWQELDTSAPPAPRQPKERYSDPVFDETMGAYVQKNLDTGQLHVLDKGYEQGAPLEGESPRKQAGALVQNRAQAITIPAGQAMADIKNIISLSPEIKFSMAQDVVGKGGTLTSGVRNFLARTSTDDENRRYETAFKGLNNAVARLSNAGFAFSKAQADAYDEAMRFTDKDTNETKIYALLTGIQHVREALKSSTMGSREQRVLLKKYAHDLEQYPTPEEFINATRKPNQNIGSMIPKKEAPASIPASEQPKTPYEWYVLRWNEAKNDPALQKKLTDAAKAKGIVK